MGDAVVSNSAGNADMSELTTLAFSTCRAYELAGDMERLEGRLAGVAKLAGEWSDYSAAKSAQVEIAGIYERVAAKVEDKALRDRFYQAGIDTNLSLAERAEKEGDVEMVVKAYRNVTKSAKKIGNRKLFQETNKKLKELTTKK